MPVTITIRNVSERARDVLARRATAAGQSMQEYLRDMIETQTERLTPAEWVQMIQEKDERGELAKPDPDAPSAVEIIRYHREWDGVPSQDRPAPPWGDD